MPFFLCGKYLNIRQRNLFSWYSSEISEDNFYFLMSNADPNVIRKILFYKSYIKKCVCVFYREYILILSGITL